MRHDGFGAVFAALALVPLAEAKADEAHLGEVVVTAQKREQRLQDVPLAITALSAPALRDAGVRDIKDLTAVVPGFQVTSTSSESATAARIRGIGTIGDNVGLESSVGIVVDGVYRPRNSIGIGDLGELARIEVLKGPQGDLFGKNTSAGVINVITRAPDFTRSLDVEATVGSFHERGGSVSLNAPLVEDVLAGRLFVAARSRNGWVKVRTGDGPRGFDEDHDRNYATVRGQLLFQPSEALSLRLIADASRRAEQCCLGITYLAGPTAAYVDLLAPDAGVSRPPRPENHIAYGNRDGKQVVTDEGLSLETTYRFGPDLTLTSITALRDWKVRLGTDVDYTSADLLYRPSDGSFFNRFRTATQELRLSGTRGPWDFTMGGFFADERLDSAQAYDFGRDFEAYLGLVLSSGADRAHVAAYTGPPVGANFPEGPSQRDRFEQKARSYALFTNNTVRLGGGFELTAGLRLSHDEKRLASRYANVGGVPACTALLSRQAVGATVPTAALNAICFPQADVAFNDLRTSQKIEEDEVTGSAKLAWRPASDLMVYASYARGYKGGGYNLDRARLAVGVAATDTSFPAEFVDAYELGLKATWLEGDLILNAAAFYQDFRNFQLNAYTGVTFVVTAIPEVISRGADIDFTWRTPAEGLTLSGGVTYAETVASPFTPGPGVSPRLPDSRIVLAPLWTPTLTANWARPFGDGMLLRATLNARYSSSYNAGSDLNPLKTQKGFPLLNGRLAMGPADEAWSVELWGQNLLDELYAQSIFDAPNQAGTLGIFPGLPRTVGATVRARF